MKFLKYPSKPRIRPKAKECEDAIAALPSEARLLAYLALEAGGLESLGNWMSSHVFVFSSPLESTG